MTATLVGAGPVRGTLHARVTRNVHLLMRLRGYRTKAALARAVDWDRCDLSRRLGRGGWSLFDLERLAGALDVHPSALLVELGEQGLTTEAGVVRARLPA